MLNSYIMAESIARTFILDKETIKLLTKITNDVQHGERPNQSLTVRRMIWEEAKRRGLA